MGPTGRPRFHTLTESIAPFMNNYLKNELHMNSKILLMFVD